MIVAMAVIVTEAMAAVAVAAAMVAAEEIEEVAAMAAGTDVAVDVAIRFHKISLQQNTSAGWLYSQPVVTSFYKIQSEKTLSLRNL